MGARELFRIDFTAELDHTAAHILSGTMGMPIGDVEDPDADVVGSQFVGGPGERVMLALSRLGAARWRIEAFTQAPSWDVELIEAYHAAAHVAVASITGSGAV